VIRKHAALVLAAVAAAVVVPASASVRAAPPPSLAVFQASSTGTPVGIVSRVPAESPGGMLLASSEVRLGKAMGKAAALTLGPLGDTFLVTSQPVPLFDSVPGVIVAQTPPSQNAPEDNAFEGEVDAGPVTGTRLRATSSDAPEAEGSAEGAALDAMVLRAGSSTSDSRSGVDADGTVWSLATATTQDVEVGPPGAPAVLRVGSVTSRASVTVPPGGPAETTLSVHVSGALLAGVPVTFDDKGVSVAGNVAVPPSSITTVNNALEELAQHGITLVGVPTEKSGDGEGAATSGAALAVRYVVPQEAPRPTDIGTDQTFLLGSVAASATARERQELALPELLSDGPSGATSAEGDVGTAGTAGDPAFSDVDSEAALGVSSGTPAAAQPVAEEEPVAAETGPGQTEFLLPARASTDLPDQVLSSYRMFVLAAVAALVGLRLTRRTRRTA
jgi:hypothetical protein